MFSNMLYSATIPFTKNRDSLVYWAVVTFLGSSVFCFLFKGLLFLSVPCSEDYRSIQLNIQRVPIFTTIQKLTNFGKTIFSKYKGVIYDVEKRKFWVENNFYSP
jgi:hypothetical protein